MSERYIEGTNQRVIATRARRNISIIVLLFIATGILTVAASYLIFIIGGCVMGGVGGALGGLATVPASVAVKIIKKPRDIISISDKYLYIEEQAINLSDILDVKSNGKTVIVMAQSGGYNKNIKQDYVQNAEVVAKTIIDELHKFHETKRKQDAVKALDDEIEVLESQQREYEFSTPEGFIAAKEMFFDVGGSFYALATKYGKKYWDYKVPKDVEAEWAKEIKHNRLQQEN